MDMNKLEFRRLTLWAATTWLFCVPAALTISSHS